MEAKKEYNLKETKEILKEILDKQETKKDLLRCLNNSECFVYLNCKEN